MGNTKIPTGGGGGASTTNSGGGGARKMTGGGGGGKGQAPVRICRLRALRITPQIRPIGGRRVDEATSPPRQCFASRGGNGAHPCGHRIVRIGGEEFRIAVQRVALQSRGVGFLRPQIANRPRA